jgi:mono/diheme cytochrome c family protein
VNFDFKRGPTRRRALLWAALASAALLTASCGTGGLETGAADKSRGKQLFVEKCGSCHTLADAGTQGKIGPNLDDAFSGSRQQGFAESTIRSVVHDQILFPVTNPSGVDVGKNGIEIKVTGMPAKLVTGDDANDVAAYVASVAGLPPGGGTSTGTATTPPAPPAPTTTQATTTTQTTTTETTTTTTGGGGGSALVAQGKQVFETAGCTSCHTLKDANATGTVGPNLDDVKPSRDKVVERVTDGKGVMPSFKGQLTPQQIAAVAAYVSTVAGM